MVSSPIVVAPIGTEFKNHPRDNPPVPNCQPFLAVATTTPNSTVRISPCQPIFCKFLFADFGLLFASCCKNYNSLCAGLQIVFSYKDTWAYRIILLDMWCTVCYTLLIVQSKRKRTISVRSLLVRGLTSCCPSCPFRLPVLPGLPVRPGLDFRRLRCYRPRRLPPSGLDLLARRC